ncbi:mitochondrial DNA polymerase catalytic subunit [Parastagonospora nodorum]|uniref:DNA-directed DNA polymerase n=1 Tax=Phaeosphaeria nodorum (strain SN15 / ATCC MYA-4574 / FGSC 10173) TaxID=321614 RepID=A0A7U2I8G9_PHANO|nr:mitochondrial DNA polymerase catalytic subunit [Parastagonospora nodorum]QRD04548.1 mitochondrial DNA polymerase catalytic subunit [Parastagonospora nodorum SN15]KAH3929147.1 mitochondrial DNA polymerase catalytic subunit [Parastagonospora nodorum]KAH3975319.1 mitochondrial DNA polymerase catalytic subunit [Parastagonospora nodorum]KAH4137585.1 mitochondrial DNA polymerase catalytic subunit [Parastagonospora nodorum]
MRCSSCRTFATNVAHRSRPTTPFTSASRRCLATVQPAKKKKASKKDATGLNIPSEARFNEIGVQQLSSHVHSQVFPGASTSPPPELVALSRDHLTRHDLLGKNQDSTPPVGFDVPELQGATLDEHFYKLGMDAAEPYLTMTKKLAWANPPPKPRKWVRRSGWTKYNSDGTTEAVDAPDETLLTFDTEVMWKETSFACMACAVSPTTWYAWLSPWLLGESDSDRHLIPLGDTSQHRIIVGHNVGYDRARIAEEYSIAQSNNCFVDTMSLHVASNGMCSRQRPSWMKHKKSRELRDKIATNEENAELSHLLDSGAIPDEEEELWIGRSAVNSLREVAKFHCNITIDKQRREYFGELDRTGICEKLDELLDYCAADVEITHRVYQKVFPLFIETCPHPVSFAALRLLAAEILPVNETWDAYIHNAEATYNHLNTAVRERLVALTDKALEVKDQPEVYENDPWLSQLDWSGQEIKMVKGKKKNDPPRPAARQKMPGMPKWYKDLFTKSDGPMNLTVRTRIAPILLKLSWDGYPLVWSDKHGWTYQVPMDEVFAYNERGMKELDMSEEENLKLRDATQYVYYKIPHKDGPQARCANPLAKGYLQYFEKGKLTSEYAYAKEALEMNASCSYWISARDRITSQMVVYNNEVPGASDLTSSSPEGPENKVGFILPQIIPMGTVTRRSVENTWLTASNAKKNRVGSELKSMVRAPKGYCFVGADVDSEELWIASLVGDATFKLHGGNAIGFMTLEGTKAAGTDLHSRTAGILGISRNDAKVFNYGRIYGAGLKFASTLLRQFNPSLTESQTSKTANDLYQDTKGKKTNRKMLHERPFWRGGTESFVFNKLEDFAEQERPRTPVLGAAITEALQRRYLSKGGFMTSRINWAIQSSGVDYLHLLTVSMDYLTRRYNLDARLAITVHDEIRYLVKSADKYRAAMALQVANLWTRAMFSQQMGINELPQSCAYFSAIDIDHVLRKEVDMDCITPSHKTPIPHGESLDILSLLEKGNRALLKPSVKPKNPPQPQKYAASYTPRTPVMSSLGDANPTSPASIAYIKAQISSSDKELWDTMKPLRPAAAKKTKKVVKEVEDEEMEISQNISHYQQMAQLMPVDVDVEQAWGEMYRLAGSVGSRKGSGVWGNYSVHPRSSGVRVARV